MTLTVQTLRRADTPARDRDSLALTACGRAKGLEDQGLYGEAADALAEFWPGVGERPQLDGLGEFAAAEVLLRAGALTGWLGSSAQQAGAQEVAKDLLSEGRARFESLREVAKSAEALVELAYCYWRQGATDGARATLAEAGARLSPEDAELRAVLALRSALVEQTATRFNEALRILTEAAPLFEASRSHALKGKYHNELAATHWFLVRAERREDYLDRAFIEYAAASFHFEQAGHESYRAAVENNLGQLFLTASKYEEAHAHLDCARGLFARLKDGAHAAQVDETRARVLLAEGRVAEAEGFACAAVRALEGGGEQALLSESLAAHGAALARLGRTDEARRAFSRARDVAEHGGNVEAAGLAELTLLEELSGRLAAREVRESYARADRLLARTECHETLARLRACAAVAVAASGEESRPESPWLEARGFVFASKQTETLLHAARGHALAGGAVLLAGEAGTGKETLARLMHGWAGGGEGDFFAVGAAGDDAAGAGELSGARTTLTLPNRLSTRDGATLFVQEVAELDHTEQARLLEMIERGGDDGRARALVIAATTRRLEDEVAAGRFSESLFYALLARTLELPPLRSRPEDIPALARRFVDDANARLGKRVRLGAEALAATRRLPLLAGNADELRFIVERTVERAGAEGEIDAASVETLALRQDTGAADFAEPWAGFSFKGEVKRFEENLIERALHDARGRVSHAARLLGFTHHESLNWRLKNRNKNLLAARTPARSRRRSVIRKFD